MNINTALAAYNTDYSSNQAKLAAQNGQNELEGGKPLPATKPVILADKSLEISQAGQNFLNKGQEIMSRYSIEHSSPRDMANMSLALYEGDVISFEAHSMLSFQPELNPEQYSEVFGKEAQPDVSRDFLAEWKDKLEAQRASGTPKAFTQKTEQMIHLLSNLQNLAET